MFGAAMRCAGMDSTSAGCAGRLFAPRGCDITAASGVAGDSLVSIACPTFTFNYINTMEYN
jgi:hypothetical protein